LAQRRIGADEVAAFDQHVRRRERDVGAALRVDREEADVGAVADDGVDRLRGAVDHDELEPHAEPLRELAGEVDGDSLRRAGRVVAAGEHRVAEVDGGAQRAARGDARDEVGGGCRERHGVGS